MVQWWLLGEEGPDVLCHFSDLAQVHQQDILLGIAVSKCGPQPPGAPQVREVRTIS